MGYQDGGTVGPLSRRPTAPQATAPAVATGIPQGGHADPAIQRYLAGTHPYRLSYQPGKYSDWLTKIATTPVSYTHLTLPTKA